MDHSRRFGARIGSRPLANLRRFGFAGRIDLVSRSSGVIDGIDCFASADELPEGVDTAVLVVPRDAVESVLSSCLRRRVQSAILFSSGYSEMGEEGRKAQARLADLAREASLPLCGPNGLGLVNHQDATPLTFGWIEPGPKTGGADLAILSQSGAMGMALTYAAQARSLSVSFTVSSGNEAALNLNDYLEYVLSDDRTKVVAVLAEQIRDPTAFLVQCKRAIALSKPIVMLKLGRSERAKASALSHTGSLAGDYAVIEAMASAHGVLLVDTPDELIDTAGLLQRTKKVSSDGVGLMSDSGALVTFALDQAEALDLNLPPVSDATRARLVETLPEFAHPQNPVDVTTQGLNNPGLYENVASALLDDPGIGSLGIFAMPGAREHALARAKRLLQLLEQAAKPIAYTLLGGRSGDDAADFLQSRGISVFRRPEAALRALSNVALHSRFKPMTEAVGKPVSDSILPSGVMTEFESKHLMRSRGIPIPEGHLVKSLDQLDWAGTELGYPLALKIQSSQLIHKTEIGGVVLNVADAKAAASAYEAILKAVANARPDAKIDGVLVERMAPMGIEIAIGGRRDPQWGPVVMVALGGIWIEVLRDIALLPAPFDPASASGALRSLRAFPLLAGARGTAKADILALQSFITEVGWLMVQHPEIEELDFNPLMALPDGQGVVLLDASIIVGSRK